MIGKYLAAAGTRNTAAQGGVSMASLRAGNSSTGARVTRQVTERPTVSKSTGDPAGYRGGRSAYIQHNEAGYYRREPQISVDTGNFPGAALFAGRPTGPRISDYRRPRMDRVETDKALSRLL